jgi:hypothetical protein
VRWLAVTLVVACAACPSPDQCQKKTNIIDNTKWSLVAPDQDPFTKDPSSLVEPDGGIYPPDDPGTGIPHDDRVCQNADVYSENLDGDESLTINTNFCGWATVTEKLNVPFQKGDDFFARVFYFQQIAPGIANAHLVATVDGRPLFQQTIPLPAPSTLIAQDFKAPFGANPGATLMLHLDNHGVNTWNILELSKTVPAPCPTN